MNPQNPAKPVVSKVHGRAQVSIELFVAISLFIVALVWITNYATVYFTSINQASNYAEAGAISATAVRGFNDVCAYGTNVTFRLPCAITGGTMMAVNISVLGNGNVTATILNNNVSVTRSALCSGGDTFVYQCQSADGEWACAWNQSGVVRIALGTCNTTSLA